MSCKSWTYPETQALLDIWQQDHIQTQLTLMARNRPVWEQVAEIMRYRKGFTRTGEQCKTRIHTLKIRYNRAKKFGLSGPEAEKECPFYRQLDAVLGRNWPRYDQEKAREGSPSSFSNTSEKIEARDAREFISAVDQAQNLVHILPKPMATYEDGLLKKLEEEQEKNLSLSFTPNTSLTVPDHKLEEMRGEHGKIIRKVLSAFKAKETPNNDNLNCLVKALGLVGDLQTQLPTTGSLFQSQDYFRSSLTNHNLHNGLETLTPRSSTSNIMQSPCIQSIYSLSTDSEQHSPTTTTTSAKPCSPLSPSAVTSSGLDADPFRLAGNKRRRLEEELEKSPVEARPNLFSSEQLALLSALSQVVTCTQDAVKILKDCQEQSLELEKKRFRFQLEAEEKRLMMESDHYRKMENLFTGLISAISQTPAQMPGTLSPEASPKPSNDECNNVKIEVESS